MLIEKKLKDALADYSAGLEVKVLTLEDDGTASWANIEDVLPHAHFMVDVPDRKKGGRPKKEPAPKESV